ncbi:MAG: beta-ketoacyl synthase N-terminal-like domain-containing protein [Synechococcus sp.]
MSQIEIAIIGIGCRFPGAATPDEFWQLLRNGVNAVGAAPTDRQGIDYTLDPIPEAESRATWGGFLKGIERFDPKFFGIPPEEAAIIDPQQRLLLEVAWESLEDAGQVPTNLAGSQTGVFVGVAANRYTKLLEASPENPYDSTTQNTSISANRISFQFNFRGPSVAINTACSSSLVAVHQACQSLILGESTLALAGGVNLVLSSQGTANLAKAGLISQTGCCRSFDAQADGFARGEGVGAVILKPLSQAEADGDRIYAVIQGTALNHNGRGNGLTAPNPKAQKALLETAYHRAGISPGQVQYVEAHGSATPLGDSLELKTLGEFMARDRSQGNPCRLGSVKTNLGNTEVVSGMAGLIKVALALKHQQIPPHLHFQEPNPYVAFDELPLKIQTELSNWPVQDAPATAGVSCFGLGGTNVHVVLTGVESDPVPDQMPNPAPMIEPALLTLSAKSDSSLRLLSQAYRDKLSERPACALRDICFTASTRRSHFAYRLAIVAHSLEDLRQQLDDLLSQSTTHFGHKSSRRQSKEPPALIYPAPETPISEQADLLRYLAQQWLEGIQIDWEQLYQFFPGQFIDVPFYQFDYHPYWVLPGATTATETFEPGPNVSAPYTPIIYVAPENELQQRVADLWQTLLKIERVGIHDNFFDLGGHSLLAMQVIHRLQEALGIDLPLGILYESPTIIELTTLIEAILNDSPEVKKGSFLIHPGNSQYKSQYKHSVHPHSLVRIWPGNSLYNPLFAIHVLSNGNNKNLYRNLARHLKVNIPIYGVRYGLANWDKRKDKVLELSISEIATHYVQEIQSIQPKGPYLLAGASMGGIVAFEITQQLQDKGEKVNLLALFDTYTKEGTIKISRQEKYFRMAYKLYNLSYRNPFLLATKVSDLIREKIKSVTNKELFHSESPFNNYLGIRITNKESYTPQFYAGKVVLFRAVDPFFAFPSVRFDDKDDLGWGNIVSEENLTIHEVPGSHLQILAEPYVEVLADKLSPYLSGTVANFGVPEERW